MTDAVLKDKAARSQEESAASIAEHLKGIGAFRYDGPAKIRRVADAVAMVEAVARHNENSAPSRMSYAEAVQLIAEQARLSTFAAFVVSRETLALVTYNSNPLCIWVLSHHPEDLKIRHMILKSDRLFLARSYNGKNSASVIAERTEAGARSIMAMAKSYLLSPNGDNTTPAHSIAMSHKSLLRELLGDYEVAARRDNRGFSVFLEAFYRYPDEVGRLLETPEINEIAWRVLADAGDSEIQHHVLKRNVDGLRAKLVELGGIIPR